MRFEAVNHLQGLCYPLPIDNIDTDQIIPARFLHRSRTEGFKGLLFHDFLQQQEQCVATELQWVHAESAGPKMLMAGENFGCGSSREHAVWALLDNGFKVIIAKSFGDIFYGNATNNGLLLIRLTDTWPVVLQSLAQDPSVSVKLDEQTLTTADHYVHAFAMDEFFKNMLLKGAQEIDMTLRLGEKIAAFEQTQAQRFPWLQQPTARI
uniref:3-isopropylmalate dehydratase small subunit n=1 Tax=Orrella sp. TaxID=1921583 RepID=UPI0040478428